MSENIPSGASSEAVNTLQKSRNYTIETCGENIVFTCHVTGKDDIRYHIKSHRTGQIHQCVATAKDSPGITTFPVYLLGQDQFDISWNESPGRPIRTEHIDSINCSPYIDEDLAITLARHDPRYIHMTGMGSYIDNDAVRYASYLADNNRTSTGRAQYIRDTALLQWAKSLESSILNRRKLKKMQEKINTATIAISNRGGIGRALDTAFNPETASQYEHRAVGENTKQLVNKALGTDQAPGVGKQFNFFSRVLNGNEAPQVNNTKIFGIGSARVNSPNDPTKG